MTMQKLLPALVPFLAHSADLALAFVLAALPERPLAGRPNSAALGETPAERAARLAQVARQRALRAHAPWAEALAVPR
jgi:hypothetical protein